MFGTIRKHQSWLWVLIIIIMSISMVVFFTDGSLTSGPGDGEGDFGSIDGQPITKAEFVDAYRETKLSQYLQTGKWAGNDAESSRMLERQAANRVYLLHKLREMDIEPTNKAVGLLVQDQIRDFPYDKLEQEVLSKGGLLLADYERFVRHEAAIRQLITTAAISARLVNPREAESLWKKENQEIDTKIALFTATNFLDKVVITNGALGAFYTNQQAMLYRLLERTVISYIAFAASNYLSDADQQMSKETNITDRINQQYFAGGTNVWKDTNGVPLPEAEAKAKIREEVFRMGYARLSAHRAAAEFGTELMNQPEANKLANLAAMAAQKKLTVRDSAPFDFRNGPEEFANERSPMASGEDDEKPFLDGFRKKALALTEERPILFNPIPGSDAFYIVARKAKLPSEIQSFDTVKGKLTNDYKNFIANQLARTAGQTFHTNLTNGLAQKKSFDELAATHKVLVIDLPPFSSVSGSLTNLDARISPQFFQSVANNLEVGQASAFIPQAQNMGWIAHLTARPPIDEKKMADGLDEVVGRLRQYRQGEAFNNWFMRQVEKDRFKPPAQRGPEVGAPN